MPITSKYLFVASMDVDPDKEDLFNEVYDTERWRSAAPRSGSAADAGGRRLQRFVRCEPEAKTMGPLFSPLLEQQRRQ